LDVLKDLLVLAASSIAVFGCAGRPGKAVDIQFCEGANVDAGEPMPAGSPIILPPSNIFDLKYAYPEPLLRHRLEGRALVRLTVGTNGKIEKVQFLRVEAPFLVKSAMCYWLQNIRYDLPRPEFETPDSRTWVLGIRYSLRGSNRVSPYPGFEKREISITGSFL
jgi:hypothetical protein